MTKHPSCPPGNGPTPPGAGGRDPAASAGWRSLVSHGFATLMTHRWFVICATLCVVVFAGIATGGTGRLIARESFGDFYDYQAAGILHGRLDVPFEAIRFEAFVFQEKYYGYFGPTPALLRIPFALAGLWFGELSRLFMVIFFAAALVASFLLLLHAVRLVRGDDARPHPGAIGLFVLSAGLGNTLIFLSSRAYIYHEAILCGAMFALWGIWCALRHLAAPSGRWWLGSLGCGLLCVHARPPTGLLALATLGTVALLLAWRRGQQARASAQPLPWAALRHPTLVAALAVVAVLSYNALSYLKFGTIEGCPLRLNVQYDDARLARIDGRQFHLANLLPNAGAYLFRTGLAARSTFPYLLATAPAMPAPPAKLDLLEPMVGIPFAMPALTVLATLGGAAAFARARNARSAIFALGLGATPMIGSMLCAIALSQRYTADFSPVLIATGCFGIAALDALPPRWRRTTGGALGVLVALNIMVMLALTLHYQGESIWGVSTKFRKNYASLRERADTFFGRLDPAGYSVDQLPIRATDIATALYLPLRLATVPASVPRAHELCEETLRHHPDEAHLLFAVGEIYAASADGRHKAIKCIEQGLQLNPDFFRAQRVLGDLLVAEGRLLDAIPAYQAALRLAPQSASTHNNLGIAYIKLNRFNEALAAFDRAQRLDPSYSGNFEKLQADLKSRP